ncbi:MAG: S8 family serine peptidase [Bacteroidia bacterium]
MRWIWGLIGWVVAQSFYIEVASEVLQRALRQTSTLATLRTQPVWQGLVQATPLVSNLESPLRGWFEVRFAGGDSVEIMERLRSSPEVRIVEGASRRRLCSVQLRGWHHMALGTTTAWTRTQGSPEIVIALIDSGIEWVLPAFHRQFWVNSAEDLNGNGLLDLADLNGVDEDQNGFVDDVIGYDFTDQPFSVGIGDVVGADPLPRDENGHGTAMASLIGARADLSPIAGVAPGCRLMVLRCFSGDGYGEDDDIARAIIYAADNGARVINCSFGDHSPSQMMHAAVRYAVSRGCVVIASSGNGTGRAPHFPSGFPEVIAVGGLAYDEGMGKYYLWPLSGYYRVDWVAPADRIPALLPNNTIQPLSGTSVASALTSAAAALLLSQYPYLSSEAVRATFASRAIPLVGNGWSYTTGSGRLSLLPALDYPQESTAGWLYPADQSLLRGRVQFVFSTYHSLLSEWDVSYATSLEGPWTMLRRGRQARERDTLDGWLPPRGTSHLRLRLRLRSGREVAYLLSFTYEPLGLSLRDLQVAPGWYSGLSGPIVNWAVSFPAQGCITTDGRFECADRVDSVGAIWLPSGTRAAELVLRTFSDTFRSPLSLPLSPPQSLASISWQLPVASAPLGVYLPRVGQDWDADGENDLIVSGLRPDDARLGRIYYLRRQGSAYQPYDSISVFPLFPRDLADWDGDGNPELLCVWIDSFFVFGGSPPKNLLWKGQGRAARLAYPTAVWLRTETGAYELHHLTQGRLLSLEDTVPWSGTTTTPRLITVPTPAETLWAFGNYSGWIFVYTSAGALFRAVSTHLADVGSHISPVDVDADGWAEILYLGQGASKDWWEIGLFSVRTGTTLWRERFWGGTSGYARLFLDGLKVIVWLPPHLYVGHLTPTRWVGEGFDRGAWEVFGLWSQNGNLRVLMGRDTLPRFYGYVTPPSSAVVWAKPGGLSPSSARLRWHKLPSVSTYRLYRFSLSSSMVEIRYAGPDTTFIETGLSPGERYAFLVEANGVSSSPFFLMPGDRPCFTEAVVDGTGVCRVRGTGAWEGEQAEVFRLMPDSIPPFFALASGATWILGFPASTWVESLYVDTLLVDSRGMYLRGDCGQLAVQRSYSASCAFPVRWEVQEPNTLEIEFAYSPPSQAYDKEQYEVLPYGEVLSVDSLPNRIRLRLTTNAEVQPLVVRWRWGGADCPSSVAFSFSGHMRKKWGFFPNPFKAAQKILHVWGLGPGEQIRVFSSAGELCAVIHGTDSDAPILWEPRNFRGERLSPGVYLLERQGEYEKLYVE